MGANHVAWEPKFARTRLKWRDQPRKITAWNSYGFQHRFDKGEFTAMVKAEESPDIIFISEFRRNLPFFARPEELKAALQQLGYHYCYFAFNTNANQWHLHGTAAFCKVKPREVRFGGISPILDKDGRVITLVYDDHAYVHSYTPSTSKDEVGKDERRLTFDNGLLKLLKSLQEERLTPILIGDLNLAPTVMDAWLPLHSQFDFPSCKPAERECFHVMMNTLGFRRAYHCILVGYFINRHGPSVNITHGSHGVAPSTSIVVWR